MQGIAITLAAAIIAILTAQYLLKRFFSMDKKLVVAKAEKELLTWRDKKETDPSVQDILVQYWNEGAGWHWVNKSNIKQFDNEQPWSAAFVSFVVRQEFWDFPKSASHSKYVVWARERRKNGDTERIAYEISEYKPEPGDIVIKRRGYTGNLTNLYIGATTHGDIVTKNTGDYIEVIGGNVSDTVKKTIVPAKNGYINHNDWFAVIKM